MYDLSLPNSLFPNETQMSSLMPDRGIIEAVEEARSTGIWRGGGAIYRILRFSTEKQASEWYSIEARLDIFTQPLANPPEYSRIMLYKSNIPDQSQISCGFVLDDFRCVYLAQYQEFFLFFSSSIDNEIMQQDDFLDILNHVNSRVQELIY